VLAGVTGDDGEPCPWNPDFAVPDGYMPMYSNSSVARNMDELRLVFTPGDREAKRA
jgi:hypothetical protein